MREYSNKDQIGFDDILLIPQHSEISSRQDVSISTTLGKGLNGIAMSIPIIAAPMDTVCEHKMAYTIRQAGGLGVVHRYMPIEMQVEQIKLAKAMSGPAVGSVGARGDFAHDAVKLVSAGALAILVDVANGHSEYAINAVKELRQVLGNQVHIMAGNVAT